MLSRYRGRTVCLDCRGTRLRKDASYVKINNASITDLVLMQVKDLKIFFDTLLEQLDANQQEISKRLILEIKNRIKYLCDVGLGYLTLNRLSNTLSGGESHKFSNLFRQ